MKNPYLVLITDYGKIMETVAQAYIDLVMELLDGINIRNIRYVSTTLDLGINVSRIIP